MSPVDYHGWTHAPKAQGGTDPIPVTANTRPWIALENLGQTLADNSLKFSLFTNAWWDPALVTSPDAGGDDVFDLGTATEDATDFWELTTKLEGWYTFEYVSSVDQFTSPPASPGYFLQTIPFVSTGIHFDLDKNIREAKDWSTGAVNELEAAPRLEIYRTIYLPASKVWPPKVHQVSGSSRGVQSHLKVWYEGTFGSDTTDNANWDFALL